MESLKILYRQDESWDVHGFPFVLSQRDFKGREKRVYHTEIGVDEANSKGFAIEIEPDGTFMVYDFSTQEIAEHITSPWSYHELVTLIKTYEKLTGDVRDTRA